MPRLALCSLLLGLSACDVLWSGFAPLNPDSCHNGGTLCAAGYVCVRETAQCVRAMAPQPVPPILDSVTPNLGSNLGGIQIELAGQFFQEGATVSIGGSPAIPVAFASSLLLLRTSLPQSPRGFGMIAIRIQNPDGGEVSRSDVLAYHAEQPCQPRPAECAPDGTPYAVTVADFNRDGKLETVSPE